MQRRPICKDGPEVPVIGFGAWPIGGGMGNVDDEAAIRTVQAAINAGQTLLDTAQAYRKSEELIGRALAGCDADIYIASKVSGWNDGYEKLEILTAIDNSLAALKVDALDLYQIHSYREPPSIEEQMETMLELQQQGKIIRIGVSNYGLEHLERAWQVGQFHTLQPRYSMFARGIEDEIVPWCREHGVGILAHSPLGKGLLTGKYKPGHVFPDDDERRGIQYFQGEIFEQLSAATEKLAAIAERKELTLPQLAIGWTLRLPEVTVCLAGAKNEEQIIANSGGQGWSFTDDELSEIDEILDEAPRV
ncbi:MAG: aldo/keto reductase [Planctomycetota bacterium]|nr:aldo/keto reductase [Planctomycetota bacterium]